MALKRIKSDVETRYLGHIRLWLDALDEIFRVIGEGVKGPVFIIVDDDGSYIADSVVDLADYPSLRMKSLLMKSEDKGVELELSSRQAVLTLRTKLLATRSMASEIERLARSTYRRRIRSNKFTVAIIGVCTFLPACHCCR
jgi:hypothetical protein